MKLALLLLVVCFLLPFSAEAAWLFPNGRWFQEHFTLSGIPMWIEVEAPKPKVIGPLHKETSEVDVIKTVIKTWANWYNVSEEELLILVQCESNFVKDAFNPKDPKGGSFGIAQFLRPTFDGFKKKAGLEYLDYYYYGDQARLLAWAWSEGLQEHWKWCYRNKVLGQKWP